MRLIVIAAGHRNVRPIYGSASSDLPNHRSETNQSAIELRRYSDLLVEQLAEPTAAEPGLSGNVHHSLDAWRAPEFSQRVLHRSMQHEAVLGISLDRLAQPGLHDLELLARCRRVP